jgi:RimJ/RimL family protein N-acetyltransferase
VTVTLRPLQESDAEVSCHWRNDARIWQYTGARPDLHVTAEIERDWIRRVLARPDERRFAICVGEEGRYVGNVQLTHITEADAEFHIFIGDPAVHGQGVGTRATALILDHAREVLGLRQVRLLVHPDNTPAIRAYEKCGFVRSGTEAGRLAYTRRLSS